MAVLNCLPPAAPHLPSAQARTELGVLPADHPQRAAERFGRVISLVEAGSTSEAKALLQGELAEDADAELYTGSCGGRARWRVAAVGSGVPWCRSALLNIGLLSAPPAQLCPRGQ